jgi:adenylate kinase family enzyme
LLRKNGAVRRVSVVGNSGTSKSRVARRLAAELGAPPGRARRHPPPARLAAVSPAEFYPVVNRVARSDSWVIDGNYHSLVLEGPFWQHADTVVWLDLPR